MGLLEKRALFLVGGLEELPKCSWLSANFSPEHYPASLRGAFRLEDGF